MKITELLDSLDGFGLIVTDDELLEEELNKRGQSLQSIVVLIPTLTPVKKDNSPYNSP